MKRIIISLYFAFCILYSHTVAFAVDAAPRISDREIIEGLVDIRGDIKELKAEIKRLDEGQNALRSEMKTEINALRSEMKANAEAVDKRFDDLRWTMNLFITISLVILGFVLV